jgi:nucleoside-diphosphate-sugar epimerase
MSNLITGGSGLIGAELARLLVGRGEDVVIFDISELPCAKSTGRL